jgi:hypothetical protein
MGVCAIECMSTSANVCMGVCVCVQSSVSTSAYVACVCAYVQSSVYPQAHMYACVSPAQRDADVAHDLSRGAGLVVGDAQLLVVRAEDRQRRDHVVHLPQPVLKTPFISQTLIGLMSHFYRFFLLHLSSLVNE